MQAAYVVSRVRPFRKIFVIEASDLSRFATILRGLAKEIDGAYNVILPNDHLLWLDSTRELVSRLDPDVLLNYSSLSNDALQKHFEVKSVAHDEKRLSAGRFGTLLMGLRNLPVAAQRFGYSIPEEVYAASAWNADLPAVLKAVNWGLVRRASDLHLETSLFAGMRIVDPPVDALTLDHLLDPEKGLWSLTSMLGGERGNGSSVWDVNYNVAHHFNDELLIVVGRQDDLSTIAYFWNSRVAHTHAKVCWIPLEATHLIGEAVDRQIKLMIVDPVVRDEVLSAWPTANVVKASRYYFNSAAERWISFEHAQHAFIDGDFANLRHPAQKTFSDIGLVGGFVVEIKGLPESVYPVKACSWDLFNVDYGPLKLEERFARLSRTGIAKYAIRVSIDEADVEVEIALPSFEAVFDRFVQSVGLVVRTSPKAVILRQLLEALGGIENGYLLSKPKVYELLKDMTPTVRTEKAIRKALQNESSEMVQSVEKKISEASLSGSIAFPDVILKGAEVARRLQAGAKRTDDDKQVFQALYDQRILLRGKYYLCTLCSSKIWLPMEQIRRVNFCPDCGNETRLPVFLDDAAAGDHYRLNQLIVRALDQGQVATLIALNFLYRQSMRVFDHLSNIEVVEGEHVVTDIDLSVRLGRKMGLVECKSADGFVADQINGLLILAEKLKSSFVMLTTLLSRDDEKVKEAYDAVLALQPKIPVFIVCSEALFDGPAVRLMPYFETKLNETFPVGPIVLPAAV